MMGFMRQSEGKVGDGNAKDRAFGFFAAGTGSEQGAGSFAYERRGGRIWFV